jgi:Leucine-rich repeat (LRR) protein
VAAMPAQKQVEAVAKKLMELNPGFDGKLTDLGGGGRPMIENGVVTGIGFVTDHVTDISPVRAFAGLSRLSCYPTTFPNGKLADLSPLRGLQLVTLSCVGNRIHDLSPLAGMKLVELNCAGNPITDISPLQGLPLRSLNVGSTEVSDLSKLKGIPLTVLSFDLTKVSTLSSLEGMALAHLFFQGTSITDLSPLQGMPLEILNCGRTRVSDLSPLKGMPLASFYCDATPIADVSPLEEIKSLQNLDLSESKVTAAGVTALQKAVPNCRIKWDDPAKAKTNPPATPENK